ncbi:hypothetical protein GCM10027586_20240 [Kineococcus gypseus]|uniref:replication protein RepA n=1 Tax=Kineococcus gypseus TaxID=1637102 RepID=UPI003D7DE792
MEGFAFVTRKAGRPPRDDLAWLDEAAQLWDQAHADIGYLARVFAQTSLPYRDPGEIPLWQRRNGGLTLTLQPGVPLPAPDGTVSPIGYPFGTLPRLLLAWLTTEAVRTKSRTIPLGESLSDFCRQLQLPITGLQIRRLKDQARRLFNARLSVHYVEHLHLEQRRQVRQEAGQNLIIASRYELWTSTQRSPKATSDSTGAPTGATRPAGEAAVGIKGATTRRSKPEGKRAGTVGARQDVLAVEVALPSSVTLSAELYEEVTHRPVPVDIGALRLLRGSPLRLDVYTWLTYRMSYLRKPVVVTWEQLRFQFGTQVSTPRGYRHFRADFSEALRWVLAIYREAKVDEVANGIRLRPSPPHVSRGTRPALDRRD